MKHFYLIANPLKEGTKELAQKITSYLREQGASCMWVSQKKGVGRDSLITPDMLPKDTECVITLGGDGTLIRAARNLVGANLPLLGVNMGTLGYLTQIARSEEFRPMLTALLEDRYHLEYRMMLEGGIAGEDGRTGIALNDIVLTRDGGMQPIHFELYVNGSYLKEYRADGIIVATPTGSTAYNLSAGGPIVTPCAKLMVLTPICSHSLNSRSIVLNGEDLVEIQLLHTEGEPGQMAVFDGDERLALNPARRLQIRCSSHMTAMICLKDVSFMDNLHNKMMWI